MLPGDARGVLQGTIQGALYGAKALAQGIGPLIFAGLFSAFTRSDSRLPFFPGGWPANTSPPSVIGNCDGSL